jgi:hypothetical protein
MRRWESVGDTGVAMAAAWEAPCPWSNRAGTRIQRAVLHIVVTTGPFSGNENSPRAWNPTLS